MRKAVIIAVPCLFMLTAGFAFAQIWEKYTPSKEVWSIIRIKVEPNKINDYLDGLHKTYVPGIEIAKKNGTIVDYRILRNITTSSRFVTLYSFLSVSCHKEAASIEAVPSTAKCS